MSTKPYIPTQPYEALTISNAAQAVRRVREIYEANTAFLREQFQLVARGAEPQGRISAHYPYAAITLTNAMSIDKRLSFGFVNEPGRYVTTLTRPDLFEQYYETQFALLMENHGIPIEIGISTTPIPIHFAFDDHVYVEGQMDPSRIAILRRIFDLPALSDIDDSIANGTAYLGKEKPLALFTAPRVDYSLHRLRHYTGTDANDFQNFVIFTNYQFYIEEFLRKGREILSQTDDNAGKAYRRYYTRLVEPGGYTTFNANIEPRDPCGERLPRMPQMPAYHLVGENRNGITLINIGVGPSNARTISDHVAVIRPHAWIMLGHCAGLRDSQKLGDYVLAHGYVRDDHALDKELPLWVPVPNLAEVQHALENAVASVTGLSGYALKSVMRTGTIVTTQNRNWEIGGFEKLVERFNQSRAIALDMESAVIAANGFRYRVPYGTLLCVSDRPLHGEMKLSGMANYFYKQQVNQHLHIGIRTMEFLRATGFETLHSRKLRGFSETAFQ